MLTLSEKFVFSINRITKLYMKGIYFSCQVPISFDAKNSALIQSHNFMVHQPVYKKSVVNILKLKNLIKFPSIDASPSNTFLYMFSDRKKSNTQDIDKLFECQKFLKENADKMTVDDIQRILLYFLKNQLHSTELLPLYEQLNITCNRIISNNNIDEVLYLADTWFCLKLGELPFNKRVTQHLTDHIKSLNVHQFIQYMFLLAVTQPFLYDECNNTISGYIERKMNDNINEISIEEVGIICLGLYRNRQFIERNYVLTSLFEKLEDSITEVSKLNLNNICKIIKMSLKVYDERHIGLCSSLLSLLAQHQQSFDVVCYTHVLSLGKEIIYHDRRLIDGACDNIIQNLNRARAKDIERLLSILLDYNYLPSKFPNLLSVICDCLRKLIDNISQQYYAVYYLACFQCFPVDLICRVFKSYINDGKGRKNYVFWLNDIVKLEGIEIPKTFQLPPLSVIQFHKEQKLSRLTGSLKRKTFILESLSVFINIFGDPNYCDLTFLLPFEIGENIVFCTNKNGIPVPVPQEYRNLHFEYIKTPIDNSGLNWHAIVLASMTSTISNTDQLKGSLVMANRYKEMFNYKTSFISERLLNKMTSEDRISYIGEVIQPFVDNEWLINAKRIANENINKPSIPNFKKNIFKQFFNF